MANFGDWTSGGSGINFDSGGGGLSQSQWTAGFGIAGLGMSLLGSFEQSKDQSQVYNLESQNASIDMQEDMQRQLQMHLNAQRMQQRNLQNLRRAQANGLAAAVASGSQYGSGLAGGQAQARDQFGFNELNTNQNLAIGDKMFQYNAQIDENKIQMASAESSANNWGGIGKIGGGILSAAGSLGQLATLL